MYWTTLLLAATYAAMVALVLLSVQKRVFRNAGVKLTTKTVGRSR